MRQLTIVLAIVAGMTDVAAGQRALPSGGNLLLSPGAPSFGEFKSYRERGSAFRSLVDAIS